MHTVFDTIWGLLVLAITICVVVAVHDVTAPETNVTTIHKQDRLQLPCPQGANE